VRYGLGIKLAVPLLLALAMGFSIFLAYSIPRQTGYLRDQARRRTRAVARVFGANLRSVMLTGDGVLLEGLLADIRRLEDVDELRLFDPQGREVYPAMQPVLARPEEQARVRAALARVSTVPAHSADLAGGWSHLEVLANEPACRSCHPSGAARGVLLLATRSGRPAEGEAGSSTPGSHPTTAAAALAQSVALCIRHAMLSQRATSVPQILADLGRTPGLAAVQVFAPDGQLRFGTTASPLEPHTLRAVRTALRTRRDAAWAASDGAGLQQTALTVLANDRLCHACHPASDAARGVVVAQTRGASDTEELANRLLAASLTAGVRNIMLSGKGSAVQRYVDRFRELPGVERLHVFDPAAKEVYAGSRLRRAATPESVYRALKTGVGRSYIQTTPGGKALVQLQALPNEEKCQRCHGSDHRYRGVIMSAVSLAGIERDVGSSRLQSLISFALTMLLLCLLLLVAVAATVVRPLRAIGSVADRVGQGDLDVRADWRSRDEIGLLAARINQMISGLRAKLHMEKFVSPSAVALIERSSASERLALGGERREVTILFTDIRGFTSFSERAEPEEVIALVNTHLEEQARHVREHHGEVDKYLGDAMMAVFDGPTMARDAVNCALAIRDALAARAAGDGGEAPMPGRSIGIGVNTGPVVRGTVGSPDRMEFTALGDAVNVAKRLCDVAAPGEILISAATYALVADAVAAEARPPLPVKGRREPVAAYGLLGITSD
jgi:class 3 adenylate cyclase